MSLSSLESGRNRLPYEKEYFLRMLNDIESHVHRGPPPAEINNWKPDPTLEVDKVMIKASTKDVDKLLVNTYPNSAAAALKNKNSSSASSTSSSSTNLSSSRRTSNEKRGAKRSLSSRGRQLKHSAMLPSPPSGCNVGAGANLEIVGQTAPHQTEECTGSTISGRFAASAPTFYSKNRVRNTNRRAILEQLQINNSTIENGPTWTPENDENKVKVKAEPLTGFDNHINANARSHAMPGAWVPQRRSSLESFYIDRSDLQFSENDKIGTGAFSNVYRGKFCGVDVAIKAFKDVQFLKSVKLLKAVKGKVDKFEMEGSLMCGLRHPNITQLLAAVPVAEGSHSVSPYDAPLLVFEYLETGSLTHYLHEVRQSALDASSATSIAIDTCLALVYLHRKQIAHLDVKSDNVFLDAYLRAKLGDMGLARKIDCFQTESASFGLTGTPAFMAPEMLKGAKVTTAADTYGFGLVMWEMAAGVRPFNDLSVTEVCKAVIRGDRPSLDPHLSDDIKMGDLIRQCWQPEPSQRPPMTEVLDSLKGIAIPSHCIHLTSSCPVSKSSDQEADPDSPLRTQIADTSPPLAPPQPDFEFRQNLAIPSPLPKMSASFLPSETELQHQRTLLRHVSVGGEAGTLDPRAKSNLAGVVREAMQKRRQLQFQCEEEDTSSISEWTRSYN